MGHLGADTRAWVGEKLRLASIYVYSLQSRCRVSGRRFFRIYSPHRSLVLQDSEHQNVLTGSQASHRQVHRGTGFSQGSHREVQNSQGSHRILTGFSQASHRLLTGFSQASHRLLTAVLLGILLIFLSSLELLSDSCRSAAVTP